MNKKGVITLESLLVISLMIIVFLFCMRSILFLAEEDVFHHKFTRAVNEIEMMSLVTSRIDDMISFDVPEGYETYVEMIKDFSYSRISDVYISASFENIDVNHISDVVLESYKLTDCESSYKVSYRHHFFMGFSRENIIEVKRFPWYGGDESSLKAYDSIIDKKGQTVYVTKTGNKYHLKGCFYLIRSTTDKKKIKKMKLMEAKENYAGCKKCFGGR